MNLSLVTYLKTYYISIKQWGTPFLQAHLEWGRHHTTNWVSYFKLIKGRLRGHWYLLKFIRARDRNLKWYINYTRTQRLSIMQFVCDLEVDWRVWPWLWVFTWNSYIVWIIEDLNGGEFPVNDFKSLHSFKTTRDLLTWFHFGCEALTWEGSTFRFDDEDHKQCRVRRLLESACSVTRDSCAHKDREVVASAFVCIARNWRSNAHNTACIAIVWMALFLCRVPIFVNWKDLGGWSCKGLSWSLAVVIDVQKMYCSLASERSLWQAEQICSSWPCASLDIGASKAVKRMSE